MQPIYTKILSAFGKKLSLLAVGLLFGCSAWSFTQLNFATPTGKYPLVIIPDSIQRNLDSFNIQAGIVSLTPNLNSSDYTLLVDTTIPLTSTTYFQYLGKVVMDSTDTVASARYVYRFIYTGYTEIPGNIDLIQLDLWNSYTVEEYQTYGSLEFACSPYNACPSRLIMLNQYAWMFNNDPLDYAGYGGAFSSLTPYQQQVAATLMNWSISNNAPTASDYLNLLDPNQELISSAPSSFCTDSSQTHSCACMSVIQDTVQGINSTLSAISSGDTTTFDSLQSTLPDRLLFWCFCSGNYFISMYSTTSPRGYIYQLLPEKAWNPTIEVAVAFDGGSAYTATGYAYNPILGTGVVYAGSGNFTYSCGFKPFNYTSDTATVSITASGPTTVCTPDSIVLTLSPTDSTNILWNNSDTTFQVVIHSSGSYSAVYTNPSACILHSDTIAVSVYPGFAVTDSDNRGFNCSLGDTGFVQLNLTGGTVPFSFAWSNSDTTQNISGLAAGIYKVTVTDVHGCTDTVTDSLSCHAACMDSLFVTCTKITPVLFHNNPHNIPANFNFWSLSFNYGGSDNSTALFSPLHTSLQGYINGTVNNGFNVNAVLTASRDTFGYSPYNYDTLLVSVIDNITGDTCSMPLQVYTGNDSAYYFPVCDTGSTKLSDGQIQCVQSGQFNYMATLTIHNNSGASVFCFMPYIINCYNYNEEYGGMIPTGTTSDTVYFASDSLITDSATFVYLVVDSATLCPLCQMPYTLAMPPQLGTLQFTAGDTVLCAGDTSCYQASAANSEFIYYTATSGASIDSITGCVSNVTGSFTVLAIAQGVGNCGIDTAYLNVNVPIVMPPNAPAPQAINSEAASAFAFVNLKPGAGGNELQWSFDSAFSASIISACFDTIINGKDTSYYTINVTVGANADTMIWLRSIDSVTGCTSTAVTTIAIVKYVYQPPALSADSIINVCAGTAAAINIPGSNPSVTYSLINADTVVSSGTGNDSILTLSTGVLTSNTYFSVLASGGSYDLPTMLGLGVIAQVLGPVDTPVIMEGDTFVYTGDSSHYIAVANNGISAVFSLTDTNATINPSTGWVSSIHGDYTVAATVYGAVGCSSATGYLAVHTTPVAAPASPSPITVYIDSPGVSSTISFASVTAGTGGNEIEWSTNPGFTSSTVVTSPANISVTLTGKQTQQIYLRSVNSTTSKYSATVSSSASANYATLSAGILDKSNWKINPDKSDEFNYAVGNRFGLAVIYPEEEYVINQGFRNKWNLVQQWDGGVANYSDCSNYGVGKGSISVCDWGNCPANPNSTSCGTNPGVGHEMAFDSSGILHMYATRLSSPAITGTGVFTCSGVTNLISGDTVYYSTGCLTSTDTFTLVNSMWEIKCRFAHDQTGLNFGMWTTPQSGTLNFMDVGCNSKEWNTTIQDWNYCNGTYKIESPAPAPLPYDSMNDGECGVNTYKQTACDFDEGWHTINAVTTPTEIIYFVDGKETFSTNVVDSQFSLANFPPFSVPGSWQSFPGGNGYWPEGFNPSYPSPSNNYNRLAIFINMGVGGTNIDNITWNLADFQIDYFRYYTPVGGTVNFPTFQNINKGWTSNNYDGQSFSSSAPVTLENLHNSKIPFVNEPQSNNNMVVMANNPNPLAPSRSSTIAPASIAYSDVSWQQKIFYAGTDGRMYNAYLQSGQWVEYPLGYNADVRDGIVSYNDRVYYCSKSNELKYFVWVSNPGQWINEGTGLYCYRDANYANVHITVDQFGDVYYIGTDNNVHLWITEGDFAGGNATVTHANDALYGLVVAPCGCAMFYTSDPNPSTSLSGGYVNQYSWLASVGWQFITSFTPGIIAFPNSSAALDSNGDLYFGASVLGGGGLFVDNDIWMYRSYYDKPNPAGLQQLGSTSACTVYDNANPDSLYYPYTGLSSVLSLSPDGNIVYYLASDGNIWYYYNDYDHGIDGNVTISPNWYRAPITNSGDATIFTVQPVTGQLFYADNSGILRAIDWESADNVISCPNRGDTFPEPGIAYLDEKRSSADSNAIYDSTNLYIQVFPNPSSGTFNFLIKGLLQGAPIDIAIFDINGRQTTSIKKIGVSANSVSTVWDASQEPQGVYYYQAAAGNGKTITGKLIKL